MLTRGLTKPFIEQPWPDIAERMHAIFDTHRPDSPMLDIVDSIIAFEAEPQLAGYVAVTDLIVTSKPVSPPPVDVVTVTHSYGIVTIGHVTHTGRNDRIKRTDKDAVGLFWRFMIEKFGVHPTPTGAPPERLPRRD